MREWTQQELRAARKMIRRYALEGQPFSHHGWLAEVHLCRLAIALSLVTFFERLRAAFGGCHA